VSDLVIGVRPDSLKVPDGGGGVLVDMLRLDRPPEQGAQRVEREVRHAHRFRRHVPLDFLAGQIFNVAVADLADDVVEHRFPPLARRRFEGRPGRTGA
jgi:hypothetical protein